METTKMKIEYRKQVDSETAPWQLLTNIDELLWNGVYALRVAHDDGSHNLPFRFENDETVTIVVKDHAHEGMLENGRTVVQTITRVDRTTGNVYVYTRTRYNAGGTHAWSYWALAGEGNAALETPKASKSSLGSVIVGDGLAVDADGKVSLAAGAVGEEQLDASITAKIASMGDKLQHAASFAVNDGIALHIGALVENNTPYSGTNYRTYTDKLLSNGEHLIVNEGYSISTYKIFDGEQEIAFVANLDLKQIALDGELLNYQLEFKKNDATAFASSELPVVIKYFRRNPIAWSAGSHIDNYIAPGTYNIRGDRTNLADGLPIYNTGSFSARLTVLAAHNCVTQVLTLLNVGGGDGNVYTRTRRGSSWGTWSKLQQNVEVGQTTSLDTYIDNGIYSGVYTAGATLLETFVMVVINNYAVAAATGTARSITQLKYAVDTNGTFSCHVRSGQGSDSVEWCEWRDLDTVTTDSIMDGAVTAQKLAPDLRENVENPLRPLFIAAGASFNSSTGFYSLNGINDLTESNMIAIYDEKDLVYKLDCPRVAQKKNMLRTIFPIRNLALTSNILMNRKFNGTNSFYAADALEVFCYNSNIGINMATKENALPCDKYFGGVFNQCAKLTKVWPLDFSDVTTLENSFMNCVKLEELRILKLHHNLNIQDSALISKNSILYIIDNSAPISAITITLHPDAYARLANDAQIVTALESKPLVSLVSV